MKRIFAIFYLFMVFALVFAQSKPVVDYHDLDYEDNLVVPEVPQKQHDAIVTHMRNISDALSRLAFNTQLRRGNEAVTVVIPCSDLFAPNDTILKASGKSKLQHFGKMLQYPTMYKIVVAVFSDNTGEEQYCDALTAARANAIEEYFVDVANHAGVISANVIPYGLGQADFVAENNSMSNRALNRRVEIIILPERDMIDTARAGKLNH